MSPVLVHHGEQWLPGRLDQWKRDQRGWVGYVWYREGPGLQYVGWLPADRLRPAEVEYQTD